MSPEELKIECLKIAVAASGQPDKLAFAKTCYEWVAGKPVVTRPQK
jgi:hypothetical protein